MLAKIVLSTRHVGKWRTGSKNVDRSSNEAHSRDSCCSTDHLDTMNLSLRQVSLGIRERAGHQADEGVARTTASSLLGQDSSNLCKRGCQWCDKPLPQATLFSFGLKRCSPHETSVLSEESERRMHGEGSILSMTHRFLPSRVRIIRRSCSS